MKKKKIVVAMSGGVDSSLTAALLLERGCEVWGVSLRVFDPGRCQDGDEQTCCSARDIGDARRVAASLGIPFSSWDVRREFEELVIAPFVAEYLEGRTPNPCVLCNSKVKFGALLARAGAMGADGLATGHYAAVRPRPGCAALFRGADRRKDQSYFLFDIRREALPSLIFPLGGLTKEEVRRRAGRLGLETASKRESQEICFVPDNDYGAFLEGRVGASAFGPGPIFDSGGRRRGTHRGLPHYTVGQRRGLGLSARRPLYVLRLEREGNALVVGGEEELMGKSARVTGVNWLCDERQRTFRAEVRIRSRHRQAPAAVFPLADGSCRVEFDTPQRALTPGQAAVFYEGEMVLGGGWIGAVH